MTKIIATTETATGLKVRIVYKGDCQYVGQRWSRANNQWIPAETFAAFDEAVGWMDDQCYEAAEVVGAV